MVIDLSTVPEGTLQGADELISSEDECYGFSIAYNDSDSNAREHQIGWTAGRSEDRSLFGNLKFVR
ncbi:MAG: hypothetical protein J6F30_13420 [Cellulosilyticum sp.]|nr:hypothetical protein [Cellulosilyticum sp.]